MSVRRFESIDHPGTRPWAAVYGIALMTPIATCLLPVMVLTLVGVLEGVAIVPYVFWAAGAALLLAALWTSFQLRRRPAEIRIQDEWARVLSIRDVARDHTPAPERVWDVRDYGYWANVTIGLTSFELDRSRWPEYPSLIASLESACLVLP